MTVQKGSCYRGINRKIKRNRSFGKLRSSLKIINNLRVKKVKGCTKTRSVADDIYQPKLWYFKLLHFLNDQGILRSSRSNLDEEKRRILISNNMY